jgi:hypothetical protein
MEKAKEGKDPSTKNPVFDDKNGNYTRDDSGGPGFSNYNAKFGDGGKVTK